MPAGVRLNCGHKSLTKRLGYSQIPRKVISNHPFFRYMSRTFNQSISCYSIVLSSLPRCRLPPAIRCPQGPFRPMRVLPTRFIVTYHLGTINTAPEQPKMMTTVRWSAISQCIPMPTRLVIHIKWRYRKPRALRTRTSNLGIIFFF